MSELREFNEITDLFDSNLRSLLLFNRNIGAIADQHDWAIVEEFANKFARAFDSEIPKPDDIKLYVDTESDFEITFTFNKERDNQNVNQNYSSTDVTEH